MKNHTIKKSTAFLAFVGLTGGLSTALAQSGVPAPAGAIAIGDGFALYPSISAKLGYDDNVRATTTGRIGSSQLTLLPSLRAETKTGANVLSLGYTGEYTGYGTSTQDNYNNHNLLATGSYTLTARHALEWTLGYQDRVDPRNVPGNTGAEPDQWRGKTASALYRFGAAGAPGRVELEYKHNNKRYQNNASTAQNADIDGNGLTGRFFWRIMPKTYLLTEAVFGYNDYRFNNGTGTDNDNKDRRLLIGATWEATAKTSGTIKLGHQKKSFDGAERPNASGLTYSASVDWSPLSYSTISLTASRSADDATSTGDYLKNRQLGINWAHQWSSVWSSRVSASNASSEFIGDNRKDDTLSTGLGVTYQMRRNIQIGLDYTHTQRDSSLLNADFKRNTLLLSLNASL